MRISVSAYLLLVFSLLHCLLSESVETAEISCPVPDALDVLYGKCTAVEEDNFQGLVESAKSSDKTEAFKIDVNPFKRRNFIGLKTFLFRYFIMPIKRTLAFLFEEVDHDSHFVLKKGSKDTEKSEKTYTCSPSNHTTGVVDFIPETDLVTQMNETSARCGFVLFYTPYCRFSIEMLPSYKALARLFPALHLFAVQINSYSSSCIQFGAVGTPTVMFFHKSRPVRKMPPLLRNVTAMSEYVSNITDLEPVGKVELVAGDHEGVELLSSFDWVLCFSVVFLTGSACYNVMNTEFGQRILAKFMSRDED